MASEVDELRERLEKERFYAASGDMCRSASEAHDSMASALLGVLELHVCEIRQFRVRTRGIVCKQCQHTYPCPTVRLILERMGGAK